MVRTFLLPVGGRRIEGETSYALRTPCYVGWRESFRGAARLSLGQVNERTSPEARDAARQRLRRKAGGR